MSYHKIKPRDAVVWEPEHYEWANCRPSYRINPPVREGSMNRYEYQCEWKTCLGGMWMPIGGVHKNRRTAFTTFADIDNGQTPVRLMCRQVMPWTEIERGTAFEDRSA